MSRRLPKRVSRAGGVPKSPDSAPGSEIRQQILKTAIQLFAQKGFRGTTTREIALAAGVNEVTIFRHFASKQELYSAIRNVNPELANRFVFVTADGVNPPSADFLTRSGRRWLRKPFAVNDLEDLVSSALSSVV